jgi:hypothetical protein
MRQFMFSDEAGNFDFRDHLRFPGASRYFAVGTITIDGEDEMLSLTAELAQLRFTLLHNGHRLGDYFHASEDSEAVRHAVLGVLATHDFRVDVTILEKSKAMPHTRATNARFYQYAWYYHFRYVADRGLFVPGNELTVVSAALGNTRKNRAAMRKAVEDVVAQCCHWNVSRTFGFWPAATDPCLQAADYALWAVMREFEKDDDRWLAYIQPKVKSTYDLWRIGKTHYYGAAVRA